jgi:hypothetical protein
MHCRELAENHGIVGLTRLGVLTMPSLMDLEAQEEIYWVSISRGDKSLTNLWPTLEDYDGKTVRGFSCGIV